MQDSKPVILKPSYSRAKIKLYLSKIRAGFPSPADDFVEITLDLNEYLIKNKSSTFFVKVSGDSMINTGIFSGDILIVDRSIIPQNNNIVVAILNGEFTVKILSQKDNKISLYPANKKYSATIVKKSDCFEIWGVVTSCIKLFS